MKMSLTECTISRTKNSSKLKIDESCIIAVHHIIIFICRPQEHIPTAYYALDEPHKNYLKVAIWNVSMILRIFTQLKPLHCHECCWLQGYNGWGKNTKAGVE